jgi:transmembrane sensor
MSPIILQKYFDGTCTAEEANQVLNWFDTTDGRAFLEARLQADLRGNWATSPKHSDASYLILQRLQQRITPQEDNTDNGRSWFSARWNMLRWAAVWIGLLVVAGWGYVRYQSTQEIVIHTGFGQTKQVELPDHSTVTLNGNSTLHYLKQWNTDQLREVWIEGEAYFKVTHLSNHKRFVVHLLKQTNVEVLGTEFNVYTRPNKTQVVLNTGKIQLQTEHAKELILRPGDLYEADFQKNTYQTRRVDADAYASWKEARLTFENTSLGEIAQTIEHTYGLRVVIKDAQLRNQQFSGTVPTPNLEVLLEGLSKLFDLKIKKDNNQITVESIN